MTECDVLLCAPRHLDYPWFRYNLNWIQPYFTNVFIALTQDTMPPDISDFLTKCPEYKNVRWIKPPKSDGKQDWRNLAVRDMIINFSKSDYVCFLEQDFLMTPYFLGHVTSEVRNYQWIYYQEGDRIHPAFSLVPHWAINETKLDFSAHPPYDHFGNFFDELKTIKMKSGELKFVGFMENVDYKHLAGLSNNYHVYKLGQPFFRPENFLAYNDSCLKLPIKYETSFKQLQEDIRNKFGTGDSKAIKNFFPKEENYA